MENRADNRRGSQIPRKSTIQSHSEKAEARRFVQIKSVLLMSDAWRDCDYSARCVFIELSARLQWTSGQSEPINNGRLWLSREEWDKAGFAPATVTRAIKQLVKVGILYRARCGGIGRGCSEYALTCYAPTKDAKGLFFNGFRKDAWAKYTRQPKKSRESKMNRDRFNNDELPPENGDYQIKNEPSTRIKSVHQESESTNLRGGKTQALGVTHAQKPRAPSYETTQLIRRLTTADRGMLRVIH